MIEKVNPSHPDKVADRIAGAIVDLAYKKEEKPKIAVEVLIGHNNCSVIIETSVNYSKKEIRDIVKRITKVDNWKWNIKIVEQDPHLAGNQEGKIRCGDNGIFKGVPLTDNEKLLSNIARAIYKRFPTDGKYISSVDDNKLIICQSNATNEQIAKMYPMAIINPLGEWAGGTDVDTGATNRKLGSDMAQSVTGGGLHGKDLSKADVSVNIYAFKKAQETGRVISLCCAIGDEYIDGKPYEEIVEEAREYINSIGGFEKFAEWGLF
jgi:S-adenosylmethionine synthetase